MFDRFSMRSVLLAAALPIALLGCDDDPAPTAPDPVDVVATAEAAGTFTTLVAALEAANLRATLEGAPVDARTVVRSAAGRVVFDGPTGGRDLDVALTPGRYDVAVTARDGDAAAARRLTASIEAQGSVHP